GHDQHRHGQSSRRHRRQGPPPHGRAGRKTGGFPGAISQGTNERAVSILGPLSLRERGRGEGRAVAITFSPAFPSSLRHPGFANTARTPHTGYENRSASSRPPR